MFGSVSKRIFVTIVISISTMLQCRNIPEMLSCDTWVAKTDIANVAVTWRQDGVSKDHIIDARVVYWPQTNTISYEKPSSLRSSVFRTSIVFVCGQYTTRNNASAVSPCLAKPTNSSPFLQNKSSPAHSFKASPSPIHPTRVTPHQQAWRVHNQVTLYWTSASYAQPCHTVLNTCGVAQAWHTILNKSDEGLSRWSNHNFLGDFSMHKITFIVSM